MTPDEAAADKSRQSAHAQEIRSRRERMEADRNSGLDPKLLAAIRREVKSAVDASWDGFVLQNGQGITISGGGKNWTISAQGVTWTGTGQCNGDGSISINLQST